MDQKVPASEYIEALIEQRNAAYTQAAIAMARSVYFQKAAEDLKKRLAEFEGRVG